MFHLLIATLAGVVAFVLFFVGVFASLSAGSTGLFWFYLAAVVMGFVAMSWRISKMPGRLPWTARIRHGMVALCVALFAGAVVAMVGNGLSFRPPKQAAIADMLGRHHNDLEALKAMVTADGLETVLDFGSDVSRPSEPLIFKPSKEAGLSPQRIAAYGERMHRAGTQRIDVWKDGTVHFSVAGWGAANRGWRMSIAWSATPPQPLLATIDGFPSNKPKGAPDYAYSNLEGPWYVYMIW